MENTTCRNTIFRTLSQIPLDIEGSNISRTGWYPSDWDSEHMTIEDIDDAMEDAVRKDEKVLFEKIYLHWDSCDCGGGYPCSHGDWVFEIIITDKNGNHVVDIDDGGIYVVANDKFTQLPVEGSTVYDFYRMCEIVGIELEFTDYAKSLFALTGEELKIKES